MVWKNSTATSLYAFWAALFGLPHEYTPAAGGSASWYGDRLGAATFLGHAVPFFKFSIYDRASQPAVATIKIFMGQDAAERLSKITIPVKYDEATHMLSVNDISVAGMVAAMIIAQRVQTGASAPNTAVGEYITLRQNITDMYGNVDITKVKDLYDQWYSNWSAGLTPVAQVTTRERFALGLRSTTPFSFGKKAERLSGVSNLLEAQRQYDRMSGEPVPW